MTDGHDSAKERHEPVRRPRRPMASPAPKEAGRDAAPDERTSPFPYAEGFDEWVADETAAPDRPQPPGAARESDT